MNSRTYEVRFAVDEHPDTEQEVVTVGESVIRGADPEQRAVVAAASNSPYTHVETLAIQEVGEDG
jgi:hypothetical protein